MKMFNSVTSCVIPIYVCICTATSRVLIRSRVVIVQIISIRDVIPPPTRRDFCDVYIATELMDTDLHQIIRSNQGLSEEHCQVRNLILLIVFLDCTL